MDRRDFLKKGALGIAGAIVGGSVIGVLAGVTTGCTPKKRIGLQLYSLRDAMREDPKGTLAKVAKMGYTDLETASYDNGKIYGFTPAEFRALVEGMGMRVTSCHIGGGGVPSPEREAENTAWWTRAIADHKAMGCKYVVVPSFHLGGTIEELSAMCAFFNRIAAMAKAEGLIFGYHNHSAEFKTVEGTVIYDYMLENTSKDVVFEMDVYWVKEGGQDPAAYIKKYAGRFPLLHIKDKDVIGASGTIDFTSIFEAAYAQGMQDYYVEVEQYRGLLPEDCVQQSFDYLNMAKFVK